LPNHIIIVGQRTVLSRKKGIWARYLQWKMQK
jgi:hypothetical protein